MGTEKKQYVIFRIGNDEYGTDINKVTIIERLLTITRVPKTPPYIKGVINLRGDIIPVMELRTRLDIPEIEKDDDTRIIIIDVNKISYGIIVDSVSEVIEIDEAQIESPSGIINDISMDYVNGVAKCGTNLITILNVEKLISELVTI
ncbi:MAG: chemotaxis protein CheW [Clostridiaceae bacterium]|nr:chemotaxis protein CheW [Clostridiaceae bacterium]